MFKALVLACFITQNCVELQDNRGPYKTEIECKARVAEMISDFVSVEQTPPVTIIQYRCDKAKGHDV